MYCNNCHKEINNQVEFCPTCGSRTINNNVNNEINSDINNNINSNSVNHKNNKIVIIVIILVLLIVGGILLSKKIFLSNSNESSNNDNNVKETINHRNEPFFMIIENSHPKDSTSTYVMGRVSRGNVKVNDKVQIIGLDHETIDINVSEIEVFHEKIDSAKEGDNIGILLENINYKEIERGQALIEPNSVNSVKKFDAKIDMMTTEEGGRKNPFFSGYQPYFRIVTDIKSKVTILDNINMVSPGDKDVSVTFELEKSVPAYSGMYFAISEEDKIVGHGEITKMY